MTDRDPVREGMPLGHALESASLHTKSDRGNWCYLCGGPWPCVTIVLARAVEQRDRAATDGHPDPCTLGPLCPYCKIERLKARLDQQAAELEARDEWWNALTDIASWCGFSAVDAGWPPTARQIARAVADQQEKQAAELAELTKVVQAAQTLTWNGGLLRRDGDNAEIWCRYQDARALADALAGVEGEQER